MPTLKKARGSQAVSLVQFGPMSISDDMLNTSGVLQILDATSGTVYDAIPLPTGAIVVGGEIIVDTAFNPTGTATLSVGDSSVANRYANAVNLKSAGRTALTLTGFVNTGGLPIRLTFALADTAGTAGVVRVNVQFVIDGRVTEISRSLPAAQS